MSQDVTNSEKDLSEKHEGLMETLEIVKDSEAMESFRQAVKQFEAGEGRDFEEFAAELGQ